MTDDEYEAMRSRYKKNGVAIDLKEQFIMLLARLRIVNRLLHFNLMNEIEFENEMNNRAFDKVRDEYTERKY